MDKLQVVDSCPAYSARGYFFRQRLVDAPDERRWFDWMCNLSSGRSAWRCPWLNLPAMSYSMSWLIGIQLIGLTHCVFYIPFWFLRQLGHDQISHLRGLSTRLLSRSEVHSLPDMPQHGGLESSWPLLPLSVAPSLKSTAVLHSNGKLPLV